MRPSLPEFRPPGSEKFRTELKEFYAAFPNTLPWIRDSRPTPQAQAILLLLESAETKGLRAEDYDGPAWSGRGRRAGTTGVARTDLVRFDFDLTVAAMRYVSDLHIGRINPRQYHFGLDIDGHDFDLSEFLRQDMVEARDISAVVETIEPPFPAYRRTRTALNIYLEFARQDDGERLAAPAKPVRPGRELRRRAPAGETVAPLGRSSGAGSAYVPRNDLWRRTCRRGETFSAAPRARSERPNRCAHGQAAQYPARSSA